jgi:hypothetical protein
MDYNAVQQPNNSNNSTNNLMLSETHNISGLSNKCICFVFPPFYFPHNFNIIRNLGRHRENNQLDCDCK